MGLNLKISDNNLSLGLSSNSTLVKNVFQDTTEHWNAQLELIAKANCIYVYTDYTTIDGVSIPAFKIGDGLAYLIDLPFVAGNDTALNEHISDETIHITEAERDFWNNKVTCFLSAQDTENVVFSKTEEE